MAEKDQSGNVSREYQTAIHEAAHAVVRLHIRMTVRKVTIVSDDETLGHCTGGSMFRGVHLDALAPSHRNYPKHFYNAIRMAMVCFAGGFAEEEYLPTKRVQGCEDDYHAAVNLLDTFAASNEQCQTLVDYVEVCTRDLLRDPYIREQISALADALVERRPLTGDEIREVLSAAAFKGV